ncbi:MULTISPECIES: PTS system mannose/fructose/sorbose family transporter subunit IID [Olsenella]|uniref:PTS system mannose/fructose/sorbose family transporter subunit IID n=1 Tax=Olsenella TaxID=133925 RepID=UPI000785ABD1|nr:MULTISPECIES: PTS system mannose/fructose/sorbose family transporter subunit IID [Olsenella]KXB62823.1 PTS system mannose/fructose/sorbose family IID component [Olsenella sp. DNF00959]
MAELKKTSESARKASFLHWIYGNLTCFSQEHMQTFGYLWAMLPIVDELYESDDEKVEALRTYTTFFNTEPQIGTMVVGLTVGLEEARANGEPMDAETINGIRAGLMGPLAGLGDSIIVGTFIPILLGIALGLSTGGNPLGPIFYIVAWNVLMYFGMKFAYNQGYSLGGSAVEALVGPQSAALRSSIVMVGTMVIGAVAATWINISTSFAVEFGADSSFALQNTLDGIMPKALNFFFVWLCWWLMTKKKISPTIVMLILVIVALVGCITIPGINTSIFNPGLSY